MLPEPPINPTEPALPPYAHLRVQRAAIGGLIALLLSMSLALRSPALPPDGIASTLPLLSGGTVTLWLWTHDLAFSTAYTTGGLTRQTPGPLRLTVVYRSSTTSLQQRLVVLPVPAWPLLLPAGMLGLVALGMGRGRAVSSWWSRSNQGLRRGSDAPLDGHQHGH